jgi:DNA-binding CsgD family transcriptional regulator
MRLGRRDFTDDLEEALGYVPASVSPAVRVQVLLELARCAPYLVDAEETLALARQAGDEVDEANALLTFAMSTAGPGQQAGAGSEAITLIAQARAMAERRAAWDVLLKAAVYESHLLEGAGEHELAAEVARQAVASADARQLSRTSGNLLAINEAEPLLALGRWDQAAEVASGTIEVYLASGPMHRAMLNVVGGSIALARGDYAAAAEAEAAARDSIRGARYEDQQQLPLARLEIALRLATAGPAAALAAAGQALDRFDLSCGSPRYAWPVVAEAMAACLAAARQASGPGGAGSGGAGSGGAGSAGAGSGGAGSGLAHNERLREEAAAVADRLRAVAEKLEAFGPAQRALQLTFAAADAHAACLLGVTGEPGAQDRLPGGARDRLPGGARDRLPGGARDRLPGGARDRLPGGARDRLPGGTQDRLPGGARDRPGAPGRGDGVGGALAAWDLAAAAWAALGEPYPLAQALLHAAEIAAARAERDGAADRLRRAARLAAGLGARPLGERIAILARRARIALDGVPAAADGGGPGGLGLTGREVEVLRLVAAGRSNREIAAELFISPKTASVHVSNILGKLGAATRGEAAARAHGLRLFESLEPGARG